MPTYFPKCCLYEGRRLGPEIGLRRSSIRCMQFVKMSKSLQSVDKNLFIAVVK